MKNTPEGTSLRGAWRAERNSSHTAYVSDGQANQALGVRFIFLNVDMLM